MTLYMETTNLTLTTIPSPKSLIT